MAFQKMGVVQYLFSGLKMLIKMLGHRRPWEKILCSVIVGAVYALVATKGLDDLLDTSVMVCVYCCWIFFSLPYLYNKLSLKMVYDFTAVLFHFFVADIAIFVIYNNIKRYASGSEAVFNTLEQRGYIFMMNFLRIIVIAYCVFGFFKKAWKDWRKMKASQAKPVTRSRKS